MKWAAGDAGKCRAAAYDLRGLSAFLADRSAELRAMDDWVATGWWTGDAAEAATGSFGKLLVGIDEFSVGAGGLAETMTEVSHEIEKASARAKTALIVGGVLFFIGTAATIVTIGASEGAAAAAAVAAEGEASFAFAQLTTYLSTAFTTALAQNALRIVGAIGFNLAIPAVGEAVHIGVTGAEFTWGTVAGVLIGSSFGIFLGELTMLAQLNLELPVYQQILAGTTTIGLASFGGSATSQQLLTGQVNWKIAGYSGAAGAAIGAIGAGGAAYVINRFKVTPDQLGAVVTPARAGEIELGPLGTAEQLTVSQVEGDAANTTIAQATGGVPVLTEEALTAANLTNAQIAALGASEGRLAAAGQITAHADRMDGWLNDVVAQRTATDAGLDSAVAVVGGGLMPGAAAARVAGGRLTSALADAQALDEEAASDYVTAASDSSVFMSARSAEYESESLSDVQEVHAAAVGYAQSLRQVQQAAALETVGPDITAVATATPEIQAQIEQADALAAATQATESTSTGSFHTAVGAPDIGGVDPGDQLPVDADAVIRSAALKRIAAQSLYGIVIGSGGGATFGGAILPAVQEPDPGLTLDPENPDLGSPELPFP